MIKGQWLTGATSKRSFSRCMWPARNLVKMHIRSDTVYQNTLALAACMTKTVVSGALFSPLVFELILLLPKVSCMQ